MRFGGSYECVIIGGGPAGLSAATYLSRFRRRTLVIDASQSRAAMIPRTRNVPGFPEGIAGAALLELMRDQAGRYGAEFLSRPVGEISVENDRFQVRTGDGEYEAITLLFATGVANLVLDFADHDAAVAEGKLRYCPICDAFEIIDKRIAIIGNSARSGNEQKFLRTYTGDITLYAPDEVALAAMRANGVPVEDYARTIALDGDAMAVETARGMERFHSIYSCLGVRPRTVLAARLGVALDESGAILTDQHQRTNIRRVYAAGDVVSALDQIAVAGGHGAIAATAIHNDLS